MHPPPPPGPPPGPRPPHGPWEPYGQQPSPQGQAPRPQAPGHPHPPGPYAQAPQGYAQAPHGYAQPHYAQAPQGYAQAQQGYAQQAYAQAPRGYAQPPYAAPPYAHQQGQPYAPPPYGMGHHPMQQIPPGWQVPGARAALPDPDRTRKIVGGILLLLGCGLGSLLFVLQLIGAALTQTQAAAWSFGLAFLPVGLYLFVPYFIDRYDPEPWWALAGVFLWGALAATGVAGIVNTLVQLRFGEMLSASVSAPIVEELMKGAAIFGVVLFLRREFDGVVDGIIYGTFAGIGFAAVENFYYYFTYQQSMGAVFVVRGLLSPWLHPLFTSMTGIGFGLGREHGARWAKVLVPAFGYVVAVGLHAAWNGSSYVISGVDQGSALLLKLLIGLVLAFAFLGLIVGLVIRKGRVIRVYRRDAVGLGTLSQAEVNVISGFFGRAAAKRRGGADGAEFARTAARLALSKWHTVRAQKGRKRTISADFIAPYRAELARLRTAMGPRWRV